MTALVRRSRTSSFASRIRYIVRGDSALRPVGLRQPVRGPDPQSVGYAIKYFLALDVAQGPMRCTRDPYHRWRGLPAAIQERATPNVGMTRRFPHPLRMSLPLPSVVLVVVHALQRDPQPRGNFFLDANDRFRLVSFLWSRRLAFQFRDRVSRTFGPRDPVPANAPAAPPPGTQTRRVQSFPATRLPPRHLSASLTIRRLYATESTPCRLLRDLRVWTIPSPGRPARNSSRPTGSFRCARRFVLFFSDHQHRLRPSRPAH